MGRPLISTGCEWIEFSARHFREHNPWSGPNMIKLEVRTHDRLDSTRSFYFAKTPRINLERHNERETVVCMICGSRLIGFECVRGHKIAKGVRAVQDIWCRKMIRSPRQASKSVCVQKTPETPRTSLSARNPHSAPDIALRTARERLSMAQRACDA